MRSWLADQYSTVMWCLKDACLGKQLVAVYCYSRTGVTSANAAGLAIYRRPKCNFGRFHIRIFRKSSCSKNSLNWWSNLVNTRYWLVNIALWSLFGILNSRFSRIKKILIFLWMVRIETPCEEKCGIVFHSSNMLKIILLHVHSTHFAKHKQIKWSDWTQSSLLLWIAKFFLHILYKMLYYWYALTIAC